MFIALDDTNCFLWLESAPNRRLERTMRLRTSRTKIVNAKISHKSQFCNIAHIPFLLARGIKIGNFLGNDVANKKMDPRAKVNLIERQNDSRWRSLSSHAKNTCFLRKGCASRKTKSMLSLIPIVDVRDVFFSDFVMHGFLCHTSTTKSQKFNARGHLWNLNLDGDTQMTLLTKRWPKTLVYFAIALYNQSHDHIMSFFRCELNFTQFKTTREQFEIPISQVSLTWNLSKKPYTRTDRNYNFE